MHDTRPPGMPVPPATKWQPYAACADTDLRSFFPSKDEDRAAGYADLLFCRMCPVRVACLASALINRDYGIWAGMSTAQREKLTKVRTRAKCPVCRCKELVHAGQADICLACGTSWTTERDRAA